MKILLIHGLGRTSLSLLSLEWSLQRRGWSTEQFSYLAFAETFDQIVARLWIRLQELSHQGAYGIAVHSLGGLLTRAALGRGGVKKPEHIVMLGTPNRQPRLASYAWQLPPFRWFTGQCGFNLTSQDFFTDLPGITSNYTIIAGTRGPRGSWSPFGNEINDGIVAMSETRLSPQDQIIQLPVMHTFMMNHPKVQKTVIQAFEQEMN